MLGSFFLVSSNLLFKIPCCLNAYELTTILFADSFENSGVLSIILDFELFRLFKTIGF